MSTKKFIGFTITEKLYTYIIENFPKNITILELGSGLATKYLSETYKMISIEGEKDWVNRYKSQYIYAPIKKYDNKYTTPDIPENTGWYDISIIEKELKNKKYDLILVDGPQGHFGRGGFYKHIELFNTDIPIIFDDIDRKPEMILMEKVSKLLKREFVIIPNSGAGIILKK